MHGFSSMLTIYVCTTLLRAKYKKFFLGQTWNYTYCNLEIECSELPSTKYMCLDLFVEVPPVIPFL